MSNLDDFFKKRDKKKKTTKKFSILDTEELVKNLEASSSKNEEESEFQESGERLTNSTGNDNLDEEWKPFDSDENKDYSGLRINIQNFKVEDENTENINAVDENEKKPLCPWGAPSMTQNKSEENDTVVKQPALNDTTNQKPAAVVETPEPTSSTTTTTSAAPAPATAGKYIPPALRKPMVESAPATSAPETTTSSTTSAAGAPSKYVPPHLRNKTSETTTTNTTTTTASASNSFTTRGSKKSQPNIMDTLEFPSLDATVESNEKTDERFDFPKKSGRLDQKSNDNTIDLQNKFHALSTNN